MRSFAVNPSDALRILHALANGTDPLTGEIFAADSPYQRAETVRALYAAIHALERLPASAAVEEETPLTPEQQIVFERLREWRIRTATETGFAPFMIAHNRMLEDMVRLPVRSEADLLCVKGFGASRVQKYGQEILELLTTAFPTVLPSHDFPSEIAPADAPLAKSSTAVMTEPPPDAPSLASTQHTREAARQRYPLPRFHPLLITEVTQMQDNHCCIAAYDLRDGIMVRPLRPRNENWVFDEFQPPYLPGQLVHAVLRETHHGLFPHRMEDRLVSGQMQVLEAWTEAELYHALLPAASKSLSGIFGRRPIDDRYFPEGTRCPSLGGLAVPRRRLRFHSNSTQSRLRLHLEDADGVCCSLSVTCNRLRTAFDPEANPNAVEQANAWLAQVSLATPVVLRVGLCRGYAGTDGEFQPKRCFLQINGIIRAVDDSASEAQV
jgi:hypothetical protein